MQAACKPLSLSCLEGFRRVNPPWVSRKRTGRVELRQPAFELDACLFCPRDLGWFVGRKEEFEFDGEKGPEQK